MKEDLNKYINKVTQGDCIELLSQLPDNCVDTVFTSPPYNRERNDKYEYYDDRIKDYYKFLITVIDECLRVSKKNVFINIMANYYNKKQVYKMIGHYGDRITQIFIWEKENPLPAQGKFITNAYEFIIGFGIVESNNTYTKNHIKTPVAKMDEKHKAIMPESVAEFFITNFTQKGGVVLDPFGGSGTTAAVATKNDRNFILFEIVKEYCAIADQRIQSELRKKAETCYVQDLALFGNVSEK